MVKSLDKNALKANRRKYGEHLTSKELFLDFIFPEIKEDLNKHIWVDLYAGEGNLILPMLDFIPRENRESFFRKHIYLFDTQASMIKKCTENTIKYGISPKIAKSKIILRDNLINFPEFLKVEKLPLYHITNPPYLYLGYIRKHEETQGFLKYFEGDYKGYQDLYQIAMMNDLNSEINNLIYIIPSNFLYGASVSNKFRLNFFKRYDIMKMFLFETKKFEFTGTNICVGFFRKKQAKKLEIVKFNALKYKKKNICLQKTYELKPEFNYRAGSEFLEFIEKYRSEQPLIVNYYLKKEDVKLNLGENSIVAIDANKYENAKYKKIILHINDELNQKIKNNILYIRTVDTGSLEGRVGLGNIKDDFDADAIYVSGNPYRTHPIQVFFEPEQDLGTQELLKKYFNLLLEHFREKLDSEFLTTYKYSDAEYIRKYLGLTQARKLIETFPWNELSERDRNEFSLMIQEGHIIDIKECLRNNKKISI
ncbi:MAG: SAM-dependent DNA methyltransferase [Candidatus Lokiarchaeota archaeon]|nr:SAM-dependent DNA methyltransferase [Candidatus Lokiarchaeota archaeon]